MNNNVYYGTGRRKNSSSRVFLKEGLGVITINKLNYKSYIKCELKEKLITQVIELTNLSNKIDLFITVKGGGFSGQINSIILGISRAIFEYKNEYKNILRRYGYLTRDSRKVERKKIGFKKSRKKPQFSKR